MKTATIIGKDFDSDDYYLVDSDGQGYSGYVIWQHNLSGGIDFKKCFDDGSNTIGPVIMSCPNITNGENALRELGYTIIPQCQMIIQPKYDGARVKIPDGQSFEERMRKKTDELFRKML